MLSSLDVAGATVTALPKRNGKPKTPESESALPG
jgi:hypothetical protein